MAVTCGWCEKPLHTPHPAQRYCSGECKYKRQYAARSRAVCPGCGKVRGFAANDPRAKAGSGLCRECRTPCGTRGRYDAGCRCAACRTAKAESTRDYLPPGYAHHWISPVERVALYERDGWTCQLCGDAVRLDVGYLDRLAPSLDHIEPQSLSLVPDHRAENLRTAHRGCNSARGNRVA